MPSVLSHFMNESYNPMCTGTKLRLTLSSRQEEKVRDIQINQLIIAGWTGRDKAAMEKHMVELEELGIKRPASTPVFYRTSASLLTTASHMQVPGQDSSGEVEFILINIDGKLWVGVASDHTDRKVEAYNITVSKQMCAKPMASTLWPYDEVKDDWDKLGIASDISENDTKVSYQSGTVAAMLSVSDLIKAYEEETGNSFGPGDAMMGGTLAAIGGVRPASQFNFSLIDFKSGRTISHGYDIESLPVVG